MYKTALIVALALFGITNAAISAGSCPSPALQPSFDAARYMGLWYQQVRDQSSPFEFNNCQQARYDINADGTVGVHNSQYNPSSGQIETANGVATFDGAKGSVTFFWFSPPGDYEVLATDYDNYALIYSCSGLYFGKAEYIWILTREETVDDSVIFSALQTLKQKVPDYDQTQIYRTQQGGSCKYLPNQNSSV